MTLFFLLAGIVPAQTGFKEKRPLPADYGKVIINNYSAKADLPPVRFDHWLHRSWFTCRLCHVDIGFAVKANGTEIKASENAAGQFCGACHNGKMVHDNKTLFRACSVKPIERKDSRCERCHSVGRNVKQDYDFAAFTAQFPKERFGNGINWEKAEEQGIIKPINFLDWVSVKRASLNAPKDFSIESKAPGFPDIIFSHKKHTVWAGCEGCHPDIFSVKKGTTEYAMPSIFEGQYCGVCHGTVAFPLIDCQRCHIKSGRYYIAP